MIAPANEAQRKGFFVWLARHKSEADVLCDVPPEVLGRLWCDAWQAGAWDGVTRNTDLGLSLSQIIQRLEELADLYRTAAIEREAEQGSPYWLVDDEAIEQLPF